MKLNNLQKDLYIFFSIIISIIVATLLWEKISLPLNNTIEASGILVNEGYNPINDTLRYIFFISLPLIVFLFSNIWIKKKTINFTELIFEKEKVLKPIDNHSILLFITFLFIIFIFLEFFSINFNVAKLDHLHDGTLLSPSQNYLSTKNFWISSYLTHGGSDVFYTILIWKILGIESIGAARASSIFLILFLKILCILLSFQLTRITNLNNKTKILFFTIFTSVLISMSHFILQTYGHYFSYRDIYVIIFLIFFIELFITSKSRTVFTILISLVATVSILFHIDIGIYLNFILVAYCFYLLLAKKYNEILFIILSSIIFWTIAIGIIGFDEFKAFLENSKVIIASIDLMHGLKYPEPFFSIASDPNGARATRGLILQLTAGLFVLNYIIQDQYKLFDSKKVLFIFLFLLSFIMYKNALSRSDAGHIRMSNDLPILINCFFILNYFLIFCEKKNFLNKFLSKKYFFATCAFCLMVFYISNSGHYKFTNIKNFSSNFTNYIELSDRGFLDKKTIKLVNYYKEVTKSDVCVATISYDMDAINYLLKKPTCTTYWSSWLASPASSQKDYIRQLKKMDPQYILHQIHKVDELGNSSTKFDGLGIEERIEQIHSYIMINYIKYNELDDFIIFKKK